MFRRGGCFDTIGSDPKEMIIRLNGVTENGVQIYGNGWSLLDVQGTEQKSKAAIHPFGVQINLVSRIAEKMTCIEGREEAFFTRSSRLIVLIRLDKVSQACPSTRYIPRYADGRARLADQGNFLLDYP